MKEDKYVRRADSVHMEGELTPLEKIEEFLHKPITFMDLTEQCMDAQRREIENKLKKMFDNPLPNIIFPENPTQPK